MGEITKEEKKSFKQKKREFKKQGLIAYGKYLKEQLAYAGKSKMREQYKKYIQDQIVMNDRKIAKIDGSKEESSEKKKSKAQKNADQ